VHVGFLRVGIGVSRCEITYCVLDRDGRICVEHFKSFFFGRGIGFIGPIVNEQAGNSKDNDD
jgi:hypothetical protein